MDSTHSHDSEQPEHDPGTSHDDTTAIPSYSPVEQDGPATAYPPGAPTPPAAPTPPPAAPYPSAFERRDHRRVSRTMAGILGAVVLVIGSGAAGIAIGHATAGGSASAHQPTSLGTSAPSTGGNGYSYGYGGGGTTTPFGQGFGSGQGYGGYGTYGGQGQAAASSTATSSQIVGLVRIQTTLGYEDGEGAGTGMILSSDGEVLTNHHVVEGATKITATVMSTGKTYTATVVGTDTKADVAVIKLAGASGLSTVKTDSTLPSTGEKVTAVGDANGTTGHLTASPGTVSALAQTITTSAEEGETSETLHNLIEIAAGVVGGDSGGAVYDSTGDVVGMTTAASTTRATGYAIPIKTALSVASALESHLSGSDYTYGRPAFLGVSLATSGTNVTTRIGKVYSGTPAAKAGLVAGETITKVGSTAVSTATQLQRAVKAYSPGDTTTITYRTASGSTHTATVTLTEGPVS